MEPSKEQRYRQSSKCECKAHLRIKLQKYFHQDPWMKEAISKEFPSTKHSFCIWHITFKFSSWFNAIFRDKYAKWCSEFYELYKLATCEEFEHQWP